MHRLEGCNRAALLNSNISLKFQDCWIISIASKDRQNTGINRGIERSSIQEMIYLPPHLLMQIVNGTDTVGGEFTLVIGSDTSSPLAFNASAAEVADAVNTMRSWEGLMLVDRQELLSGVGDLFEWRLTFPPAEGDVEELRVRSALS